MGPRVRVLRGLVVLSAVTAVSLGLAPAATPAQAALPLSGKVVVLDPGHNGGNASHPSVIGRLVYAGNGIHKPCNTVGTSTDAGYPEHAFNRDVAVRAAALLRARGAKVVLTRPDDTGVGPCVDVRARIGNDAKAHAVVAIHADGNLRSGARGFHVIMPAWSGTPSSVRASSAALGHELRASFRYRTGLPHANYVAGGDALDHRSDLGGLNLSTRPAVFIEAGNMRDRSDAAFLSSARGRQRAATGIANGVTNFLTR